MSYLHLTRERTRERTPEYDTCYRPLARRDSKRQRSITLSDDEEDDYPYSPNHKPAMSSRALTIRNQPSQLERYNIWSDKRNKKSDDDDEKVIYERRRSHKYTPRPRYHFDFEDESKRDAEECEYTLKVQATFSKPKFSSPSSRWPLNWLSTTKEKWTDEDWETRERSRSREHSRRDSLSDDDEEKDEEKESWSRHRRIKRTKTEEFKPLSGWRRERIVHGY